MRNVVRRSLPSLALVLLAAVTACAQSSAAPPAVRNPDPARSSTTPGDRSPSRVETRTFTSQLLGRSMPYFVYLPAGYDSEPERRYPAVYLLHGVSGTNTEWLDLGLAAAADKLMGSGEILPFVVVLPQGDRSYWVDQSGGARWGSYLAQEVVHDVDEHFRTIPERQRRAIGGLSMGAHGALQLALNNPDVFAVLGAHSPTLRREDQAPVFFGHGADFAARDPVSLALAKPDAARRLSIWIDIGAQDPWEPAAAAFDDRLSKAGIPHVWHEYEGGHSKEYWAANLPDYLRYYATAFATTS